MRFLKGEQPVIAAFGRINSIFIVVPNESIINCGIEPDVVVVDEIKHDKREGGVQRL